MRLGEVTEEEVTVKRIPLGPYFAPQHSVSGPSSAHLFVVEEFEEQMEAQV